MIICLLSQAVRAEGPRRYWKRQLRPLPSTGFRKAIRHGCVVIPPRFTFMPVGSVLLASGNGADIYCYSRRFYHLNEGGYSPFVPMTGQFFPMLPGSLQIGFRGRSFFWLDGSFFRKVRGGFVCVLPPAGIRIPELHYDQAEIFSEERGLYRFRDQLWRQFDSGDGLCFEFTGFCRR